MPRGYPRLPLGFEPGYITPVTFTAVPVDPVADWHSKVYGAGAGAISGKRRPPPLWARREQLTKQENRCIYCHWEFGSWIAKRSRPIQLRIHWDHWVPHAYLQANPAHNFVAACQICNCLKRSDMFETVEEARRVIAKRRDRYPIRFIDGPGVWVT